MRAPRERLAVIDLGSNSFRLVVFMAREGWWRRTDEIYEPVRIGEGLTASGRLGEEPMRARAGDAGRVRALLPRQRASAAVRSTRSRPARSATPRTPPDFLTRARERTSLPIRVLSREEEARYGYLAAVNSTTLTDGCVLDLGGGSLQLVRVADRLARRARLLAPGHGAHERALPAAERAGEAQADGGAARARRRRARQRAEWLRRRRRARGWSGIGGTVRNLAAAAQRAPGLPSNGVQGDGDLARGAG